jgi:hypothetical protein
VDESSFAVKGHFNSCNGVCGYFVVLFGSCYKKTGSQIYESLKVLNNKFNEKRTGVKVLFALPLQFSNSSNPRLDRPCLISPFIPYPSRSSFFTHFCPLLHGKSRNWIWRSLEQDVELHEPIKRVFLF